MNRINYANLFSQPAARENFVARFITHELKPRDEIFVKTFIVYFINILIV